MSQQTENQNGILRISHAHKYYNRGRSNQLHVMNDVSLSLPASGLVAIFGKSGCGKTTLLNAVGGLDRIAEGSIQLFGQELTANTDTIRNKYVGYIFQNYNLNTAETVFENVADALRLCGMTDEEEIRTRVLASLKNVEMDKYKSRTPDTLSGGQQQRVAIARALVKNPAIILADEPTGNLDENNTVLVMDILKEISKDHLVLLVTHEANLVDFYCDRVIEIVDGRIVGDRVNEEANGYVQRNKNDVYLGELEKTEGEASGVHVTRYGGEELAVSLRLVTSNGKTYLVCDTPGVKILDETSEIRLREGVFHETARSENSAKTNGHDLDMSALTPFEGKNFGRLFTLRTALKSAWTENFAKKQKKGRGLLRATLVLLAGVLVFMTAISAISIRQLIDVRKSTNPNLFFLALDGSKDYSKLLNEGEQNGIDAMNLTGMSAGNAQTSVYFNTAAFMTAGGSVIKGTAYLMSNQLIGDKRVAAGSVKPESDADVVITTALADELLDSSTVSYIDSYQDLIHLVTASRIWNMNLRICGVVESPEKAVYADPLQLAAMNLRDIFYNYDQAAVRPFSSQDEWTEPIPDGQMVSLDDLFADGETVSLLGRTFRINRVSGGKQYTNLLEYGIFVQEKYGTALVDADVYVQKELEKGRTATRDQLIAEWTFEYYPVHLKEFIDLLFKNYDPYQNLPDPGMEAWIWSNREDPAALLMLMSSYAPLPMDPSLLYNAYLAHQKTGTWPETAPFGKDELYEAWENLKVVNSDKYYRYIDSLWSKNNTSVSYIVSDADFIRLAGSVGVSDARFNVNAFNVYTYDWTNEVNYQNHMIIHSTDPALTEAFLLTNFDNVVTPSSFFSSMLKEYVNDIITSVVTISVVLILMCLCVFFIMRSSFMSRVREVGIYRAIGVSKKNLLFRFFIEALLLTTMTVLIGFLISSGIIVYLSGAPLISEYLYFPVWLGAILLAVVYAASVFFGILPVMTLLSKTPSEILAKYDI